MSTNFGHSRYLIKVRGTVQGVGFRPYVYNNAVNMDLRGRVFNSSEGVIIDVEGERGRLLSFIETLRRNPPPLAKIESIDLSELPLRNYPSFLIVESEDEKGKKALIPPDIATCSECKRDILDPNDRRYMYPFTNCTNCGPRFTIATSIPYDRERTSMRKFMMCTQCESEYHDPEDRRFHAQPVCCPLCGPNIWVCDKKGNVVADNKNWLSFIWERLKEGKIVALKSLGGFHLSCDAKNEKAIMELRVRKKRPRKPLAVMVKDIETSRKYCLVDEEEERILRSARAPIVALKKREDFSLPQLLSPGIRTLGVMLPYTPLHILLFSGPFDALVMTSGNVSELPIVIDNEEALDKLGRIADYFVLHNRDIVRRCDDSVLKVVEGKPQFFRLSRGYVPEAIPLPISSPFSVLGIGGEMKNNFCLIEEGRAFMSQYIGELDTEEGRENLLGAVESFLRLLGINSLDIIGYDLHPQYSSSEIGRSLPAKRYVGCQHHHSHLVSCMGENGLKDEDVIGVILDGTGFGEDGNLWGFEILKGNYREFSRLFHLAYCPLPGGEKAIREPWRMAVSYLYFFLKDEGRRYASRIFGEERVGPIVEIIEKKFNSPLSCGCGRLFDAVSALIGLCEKITYEGQGAIELGELVDMGPPQEIGNDFYPYEIRGDIIDPEQMIRHLIRDKFSGLSPFAIAKKFHNTIVRVVTECVKKASDREGLKKVVLSGGTFHNDYILTALKRNLVSLGFEVYHHTKVPPNDGGISLGQAIIALARTKEVKDVFGDSCEGY
jgi:hydrogenase maturation protein HypF